MTEITFENKIKNFNKWFCTKKPMYLMTKIIDLSDNINASLWMFYFNCTL